MERNFLITNVEVYCPNEVISGGYVLVEHGIIKEISRKKINTSYPTINGGGKLLVPGFIDIHVNGGGGEMSIDGSTESIEKIVKAHSKFGTTGMLITTISVEDSLLLKSVSAISKVADSGIIGAKIIGIHLEGPFLNIEKRGAHQRQFLKNPDIELFNIINNASNGKVLVLSLAPELEGAFKLIEYAVGEGIIVGLAHSEANYTITNESISKGLSLCTHLFNGMIPFSHKEPGPVGAFLTSNNTYIELITDGVHIAPAVMEVVYKAKDKREIIIVTDAVTPAGTELKNFDILGVNLEVRGNSCFLPNTNNLAGSSLTMNVAVRSFVENTSCSLLEAINMASINPATLLKIANKKGSIEIGKDADLVLTDNNLEVFLTMVEGQIVYKRE